MDLIIKNEKSFKRRIDMLKFINKFSQYKIIVIDLECSLELLVYFKIRLTSLSYK